MSNEGCNVSSNSFSFIVIGGGIAGVTCAETLSSLCPEKSILLLSASPIIKAVVNFQQLSRALQKFDVEERSSSELSAQCPNVTVVHDVVVKFDHICKEVTTSSGKRYCYNRLCICTGGQPKVIAKGNPLVLGIRDTETILDFEKKLANARRIVVVGNGGIATEIVYRITNCDVVWAIKDKSIVSTFVDAGAAKFFMPQLGAEVEPSVKPVKRIKYELDVSETTSAVPASPRLGAALGPDWTTILPISGNKQGTHNVHVEYEVEISELLSPEAFKLAEDITDQNLVEPVGGWPLYVKLTNGRVIGCDFVVSATGVVPNIWPFVTDCHQFEVADDGGIKVDGRMQTGVPDVFAAGDVCHAAWEHSPFWIQMRLWNQARLMGYHAAQCMVTADNCHHSEPPSDFGFELFAHVTQFFGYKVILLGRFNGQGLDNDYNLLIRVTEGEKYVKAVLRNGRLVGAVLIGETDLEETFENLILNQLDLSSYGDDLLDQDLEDFFD